MKRVTLQIQEDGLQDLAKKLVSNISALNPSHSEELISTLIFELARAVAEQNQKEERRRKQAEGITAAKAGGVQFGRPRTPLPDNFDECYQAWQDGKLSLRKAAESCGMGKSSFRREILSRSDEETVAQST